MIIIYIVEFLVPKIIKLNTQNMVGRFTVIGAIEKTQIISRCCANDVQYRGEKKGESMSRGKALTGSDGEDEGGGEGKRGGGV